jgi:hypothetical protein
MALFSDAERRKDPAQDIIRRHVAENLPKRIQRRPQSAASIRPPRWPMARFSAESALRSPKTWRDRQGQFAALVGVAEGEPIQRRPQQFSHPCDGPADRADANTKCENHPPYIDQVDLGQHGQVRPRGSSSGGRSSVRRAPAQQIGLFQFIAAPAGACAIRSRPRLATSSSPAMSTSQISAAIQATCALSASRVVPATGDTTAREPIATAR